MEKRRGRHRALTPQDVKDIREFYYDKDANWRIPNLAKIFHVSETTIHGVIDRKGTYKE